MLQKEDYNEAESSHAASLPILRHLVTLLLGPEDASRVSVITRRHIIPARRRLFIDDLQPELNMPSLASLPSLSLEKRLSLLLQPTGVEFPLQCLPEEWRLFFLALAYWASHTSQPPVSDKHVHAAVLGVIMLALVRPSKKEGLERSVKLSASAEVPSPGAPDIKNALKNVKSSNCGVLYSSIYVPHSYAESRNHKASYDLSVVHSFAQLQSALMFLSQLNQLLGMPLKSAPLHRLFSGNSCDVTVIYQSLVYRVYKNEKLEIWFLKSGVSLQWKNHIIVYSFT